MFITHNLNIGYSGESFLENLNLSLDSGKKLKVALVGENGSGKTTFLKILAGEQENFKGQVSVKEGIKIAWLRQHSSLEKGQTVENTITKTLNLSQTELWRLLVHYKLKDLRNANTETLSGGEKKRLEMAILIHSKPDILFLDEATNHLDLYTQEELQNFLENIEQTIVYVSHDNYLIEGLGADELIEL